MLQWKPLGLGVAVLLAASLSLGLAACGGDDDDDDGGASDVVITDTITIVLKDNVFQPKEFSVKAGAEITVVLKNDGRAVHNMHVLSKNREGKDFSSSLTVNPGKEDTFTMTLTKTGTVNFQCDYHLPDMSGKITVK